jgi:hypothetical protein
MPDLSRAAWRKSSFSNGSGACVEFARLSDGTVGVRDSKDPDGAILRFTDDEVRAFILGARAGELDPDHLA